MQKTIMKFLMWFLVAIVALPAMIFSLPTYAKAKETVRPVTSLLLSDNPNDNGWFDKVIFIKLKPDGDGTTYFQWNSNVGAWSEYDQPIRAWQGENTLYYYTVSNKGEREGVKSQVIKVDYHRPEVPAVYIDSFERNVQISWGANANLDSVQISKDGDRLAHVPAKTGLYIDNDALAGETHLYKLKMLNHAGLKSKAVKLAVQVSAMPSKTILPSIGEAATITAPAEPSEKIASAQRDKVIEEVVANPPANTPQSPIKNWNRLFIAFSILIIAAGAAIAGYYGYEWWMSRREAEKQPKKTNSRW